MTPARAGSTPPLYDRIGRGYATHRVADARWQAAVAAAVGDAAVVVNVGAGAGSYEPAGRTLVAIEPSAEMIAQRRPGAAPAVRGVAEALPLPGGAADVALAVLTTHHWTDAAAGLAEMRRVARRQVVLTWDPAVVARYWLVAEYLPEIAGLEAGLATLDAVRRGLAPAAVTPLPVPRDCSDGVLAAYWARPEAYLDPGVRRSISGLSLLPATVVGPAMERLAADLAAGRWHARHGDLLRADEADVGYRLVVGGRPGPA
ncbi:MAG TPA: methyltransferase domain-containing protein [Acidimicrobiales bacterium]|nr:methyltransferase domain-containing protein [Acidimicrobiales bacterium]